MASFFLPFLRYNDYTNIRKEMSELFKSKVKVRQPENEWFKELTFYQIWCRSFKDGNGDGIGDLYGVLESLDYIKSLGVDAIWFSPLYKSPQADFGYDVADYKDIDPDYGTLDTFRQVVEEAHKRGIRIIMDLVVNHSSDECEWFKESLKGPDNPYHDYYFWRKGKDKDTPPNNWLSLFEGNAWEYNEDLDEYYLHIFAKKQPDLNHDNEKVREEVKDIMRFWLDMGVDGFREDVITYISKKPGLPDGLPIPFARGIENYDKGPNLDKYLREYRETVADYEAIQIAETGMATPRDAFHYTSGDDRVFDMLITFDHMNADCLFIDAIHLPFSLRRLKHAFGKWQRRLYGKAWNLIYIENHDHARVISRYGNKSYWKESGKALATATYMLTGTPFIYQGQEIGMLNTCFKDISECRDVVSFHIERIFRDAHLPKCLLMWDINHTSREHARTPVQWNSKEYAGFSETEPWFPVNPNYNLINVADEEKDPDSILNYYRKVLKVRKEYDSLFKGKYRDLKPLSGKIWCYEKYYGKEKALVMVSFSKKTRFTSVPLGYNLGKGKLILHNYEGEPLTEGGFVKLRPYEAFVYIFD